MRKAHGHTGSPCMTPLHGAPPSLVAAQLVEGQGLEDWLWSACPPRALRLAAIVLAYKSHAPPSSSSSKTDISSFYIYTHTEDFTHTML